MHIDAYARGLAALLEPGGRLLNHGIARLRHGDAEAGPFSERYVFPDAAPLHLSRSCSRSSAPASRPSTSRAFASDYAQTLTHWANSLDDNLDARRRARRRRALRVWRLYLRAARNGFRTGFTSIYQVRAVKA